uniref:EH domain-containing protein n=1 Tax=Ditylenchus dipsaci TaxID=166011 RepID=A0A915CMR6_9BILA
MPDPPSKPATPIGALTPGFKSIFEDKDATSWPIDTSKYEADFRRIDTDYDVSGVDAKQLLMSCGLPQHVLAQIWALVDMAHAGRITLNNLHWCKLELTNECRHGIRLPEILPAFLVPPSTINRTMGVSNSSASLTNNSTPGATVAAGLPSSNPRIIELNEEIEKKHTERLEAEKDRLDKVKLEISQANDNFTAEEEILQSLKEEEKNR